MIEQPYDEIDGLTAEALKKLQNERLQEMTSWAFENVPHYSRQIKPITTTEELGELPTLGKKQLVAGTPPRSHDLLSGPIEDALVFKTGGTTGEPKFIPYSHQDWQNLLTATARALWASGLRPADRVANCFAVGELYASFLAIHGALEKIGVVTFPFTFHASQEQVVAGIRDFNINTVMGLATQMVHLCDKVHREIPESSIEKIFYAAEHLYPEERAHLEKQTKPEFIATAAYGAVDGGMIGYQCPHCEGSIHHVLPGTVIVEVVDPETFQPTDQVGEILVTNLERRLMPIIRYRLGDLARWIEGPCPCGRATPRFELMGRGDDQLRIGYESITHDDVRLALKELSELSSVSQLIKQRVDGKDLLILKVETRGQDPTPELEERARQAVLARKTLLAEHIETAYTHPLEVQILRPNSIERKAHSGKYARVVDESYH